jgi:hypothetical protein
VKNKKENKNHTFTPVSIYETMSVPLISMQQRRNLLEHQEKIT